MLLRFGGASSGNSVEVFNNGDDAFEAIWSDIDGARRRIWVETYILEPDRVGMASIDALARAVRRGCDVRLLYDAFGSPRVSEDMLKPLRDAAEDQGAGAVEIDRFNPLFTWRRRPDFLQRDHRKIIVIDDHIAFCGGMNFSEDYASERHGNGRFHDCHVRVCGPCARDLARVTLQSLALVRDAPDTPALARTRRAGKAFVQVLNSRGAYGRRAIQRSMRLTARYAVDRCWITTPYFIPPRQLMNAMLKAAGRGVDVRVLTAGISDVPVVRLASQHIYGQLLQGGVRIWEYHAATLHAKTAVIDGVFSSVGSFNLDTWSHKRNLEVKLGVIDADIAHMLETQFETFLKAAQPVTMDNWTARTRWQKLVHWCAYQLMRL